MALRNQPYLPLYVQDFLTDEKLMECSAQAVGVYIKIMCIMHKSEQYGKILLKQKDKQKESKVENFAYKLAKFLPFDLHIVTDAINELLDEGVLSIDNDLLIQKRMVKDNEISIVRAIAGAKGGTKTMSEKEKFAKAKPKANGKAKHQANTEYEDENSSSLITKDIQDINIKDNINGIKKDITIPALPEFLDFAKQVCTETGLKYGDYGFTIITKYETWIDNGWKDGNGSKIKNWKLKFKNTLPYLKPIHKSAFEKKPKFYAYFEQYPEYFNPDGTPRIEN